MPTHRYELSDWSKARVNVDYHVAFENRFYSVHHALIGARVEVRATVSTVEVLHGGKRVASHRRSYGAKGSFVTCEEHRPVAHRDRTPWPPERMIAWGASFGPHVARVVELTLARYPHPEQGIARASARFDARRNTEQCAPTRRARMH